jgi:hypothetical protein
MFNRTEIASGTRRAPRHDKLGDNGVIEVVSIIVPSAGPRKVSTTKDLSVRVDSITPRPHLVAHIGLICIHRQQHDFAENLPVRFAGNAQAGLCHWTSNTH